MRRVPVFATMIVLLAVGAMVGLGIWQIQRARWKEALIARYTAAVGAPLLDGLPKGMAVDPVAFRRAHIVCILSTKATQLGGHNSTYQSGFRNIAGCRLADRRVLTVDLGWSGISQSPPLPTVGQRLDVTGRLIPDDVLTRRVIGEGPNILPLLLVAETPVGGLQPSVPPEISDIPNNHRSYAVQWFLFAGVALVIFVLAAQRRFKSKG